MKSSVILLFVFAFYSQTSNAQRDRATLLFKNGSKLEGLADLKTSGKIKFRKGKKAQKTFFTFNEVDTLKIYEDRKPKIFVQIAVKDEDEPKVLELVDAGKKTLYYRDVFTSYGAPAMMPGAGGFNMTAGGGFYSVTNSYLRKPEQQEATYLASTNWLSKNFKKAASEFFADCPDLVTKIQNRELKKKHLKEIITYYNSKCE